MLLNLQCKSISNKKMFLFLPAINIIFDYPCALYDHANEHHKAGKQRQNKYCYTVPSAKKRRKDNVLIS